MKVAGPMPPNEPPHDDPEQKTNKTTRNGKPSLFLRRPRPRPPSPLLKSLLVIQTYN